MDHAVDPGDRSRSERALVATTGSQEVGVEVIDVRGGQFGQVHVAEVGLQVAIDDRSRMAHVEADQPGDAASSH